MCIGRGKLNMRGFINSGWAAFFILLVVAVTLYGRVLGFGYVWDDSLLFLDKTALLNEPLSWALLSEPVLPGTSYLRPLVFLTFFAEFHLFGQSPAISHGVNLGIFILNVTLIYFVACKIGRVIGRRTVEPTALLAALLYLVHPALVESTAWASGRFDQMVTTFILLAVMIFLSPMREVYRVSLIALVFFLALLSKELGAILPAILFCIWVPCNLRSAEAPLQTFRRAIVSNAWVFTAMAAVLVAYFLIRAHSVGGVYHSRIGMDYIQTVWFESLRPLEALKFYVQQLFIPFHHVHILHPQNELAPWRGVSLLASVGLLLGLIALLVHCWVRRTASSWLALAGIICLLPVIHLIPLDIAGNIGHERFMTAALAFFSLSIVFIPYERLLAVIDLPINSMRRILGVLFIGWFALSVWTVNAILPFWKNELQLWNWAYSSYPDNDMARYNYLYGALQEKRADLVIKEIQRIQKEKDGLEVGDQILYANLLIRQNDKEALNYLQGVMLALPKFHEQASGHYYADRFLLTATQMGGAYSDYANGLLLFEGNANEALKYNDISAWYLRESEKIPLKYQRVAIYYAMGDFSSAEKLLSELDRLGFYRKDQMKDMVAGLLTGFCASKRGNADTCQILKERSLLK